MVNVANMKVRYTTDFFAATNVFIAPSQKRRNPLKKYDQDNMDNAQFTRRSNFDHNTKNVTKQKPLSTTFK